MSSGAERTTLTEGELRSLKFLIACSSYEHDPMVKAISDKLSKMLSESTATSACN